MRKVEAEVIVEEGGVGDVHFETAYVDVAGKQDIAVRLNDDVAAVGFDNDELTIANDEFLNAMDTEIERGEIKLSIVLLGIGLKGKGVVVVTLLLDDCFVETNEFVMNMYTGAAFVIGDETVTGEAVNHKFGLSFIHSDEILKGDEGEVLLHVVSFHVAIHTYHGANIVDALDFAVFVF